MYNTSEVKKILAEFILRFKRELTILLVAMLPVVELRGAIPLGLLPAYSLTWYETYLFAVIGNMIPVPFIILFVRQVFKFLRRYPFFKKIIDKIENKVLAKADKMKKLTAFGLFVFVAIPLPGTGAWTGALISVLLNMRMCYSLPAIFFGVLTAGFIMTGVSYGFLGFLSFFA